MLLDLRKEGMKKLAFYPPHQEYSWPYDDIIVFAFSCRAAGSLALVCDYVFGITYTLKTGTIAMCGSRIGDESATLKNTKMLHNNV